MWWSLVVRQVRSFGYAFEGWWHSLRTQGHVQFHALATVAVVFAAFCSHVSATEGAILALSVGMVWAAELMNTALEHLTNLASPEYHLLAKRAKDAAAAAVLVAAAAALIVAALVFLPKWC